jgi:hypothetical protein
MSDDEQRPHGFDPGPVEPPVPLVDVSDDVRDRMVHTIAALVAWVPPEDIARALESGVWPAKVTERVALPSEADEMHAYVDVLLVAMQSPAVVAG